MPQLYSMLTQSCQLPTQTAQCCLLCKPVFFVWPHIIKGLISHNTTAGQSNRIVVLYGYVVWCVIWRDMLWLSVIFYYIPLHRLLVTKARKIAQQYHLRFKVLIPVAELVQKVASVMQEYTQSGYEVVPIYVSYNIVRCFNCVSKTCIPSHNYSSDECFNFSGVRPFGVSLLICGWDDDRPFLFQCDPSVCNVTISKCCWLKNCVHRVHIFLGKLQQWVRIMSTVKLF